jgi:hypothetical protein
MLSILCHFRGLLFARQCWTNRYATQRNAPHLSRNAYRDQLSMSALAFSRSLRAERLLVSFIAVGIHYTFR